MKLQLNDRWTPRQTLRILDCIQALYEAIWDAHEDELLFHLDIQQKRRRLGKPATPSESTPTVTPTQEPHEDDFLF